MKSLLAAWEGVVIRRRSLEAYEGGRADLCSRPRFLGHVRAKGARVFLGKGAGRGARLRAKALVVGGRTAFVGSANLTGKAIRNAELCWLLFSGAASGLGAVARFI